MTNLEITQVSICKRFSVKPLATLDLFKVGIALNIRSGLQPVNGLRLNPKGDSSGWYILWEELDKWANDIGLIQNIITVKPFYLPEYSIGIKDLTDECQASLDGADVGDDWSEEVQRWQDEGDFVFVWEQEYYMNQGGEVTST